ncbi:hypothetical protein ROZALSC1DRAFT_31801 [Rozella allomycis CSF55]|uniref:Uncharacterized protein n=1 Tax=Rozella allomycis (strain CSF55) TaxID=988480 RepID=A0A4P9YD61_ROZAC|nr:hypothetical protein ROZALSC1DRAFT_31801 [Rozella allomycis CSF55]
MDVVVMVPVYATNVHVKMDTKVLTVHLRNVRATTDTNATTKEGYIGLDCSVTCVMDPCGICNGDGSTCIGCDGIPASGKTFDACQVCGGDNSTCAGCDGKPYSGAILDECGVCDGDGSTCRQEAICNFRTTCSTCLENINSCFWCNETKSCHDNKNRNILCKNQTNYSTCPQDEVLQQTVSQYSSNELTSNTTNIVTGVAIAGAVGAAVGVGILFSHRRKTKNSLDATLWADVAINNPLYKDRTLRFENPLYQDPGQYEKIEDED